jgi:hypothetical protein
MEKNELPRFFRVRQNFPRPVEKDIPAKIREELTRVCNRNLSGRTVAITVGSRGIANLPLIVRSCIDFFKDKGAQPLIIPAMGSHGGGTADGQRGVLASLGVNEDQMGCAIVSSMEVVHVCQASEGFPVYFDRHAWQADDVLVLNRVKPHTRFSGQIESGLMKMMLIGLGKQEGAEVYHRTIVNFSFDKIVRSVAHVVIDQCHILAGLAILENGFEETAQIVGVHAQDIEHEEPQLLARVKSWMPQLPFDRADLLMIDQIGKDISGTGMDTNVIGRKFNDHAAINGDVPDIHHIYVRSLTSATGGNASGIGLAEMCHRRVVEQMDHQVTRNNCITACHLTGAMVPIDFPNDWQALQVASQIAGFMAPNQLAALWIRDTLSLSEVECSEAFLEMARAHSELEILRDPTPLEFDQNDDFVPRFPQSHGL